MCVRPSLPKTLSDFQLCCQGAIKLVMPIFSYNSIHAYNIHVHIYTHRFTVKCLVWRSLETTMTPSPLRSSSFSGRSRNCLSASPNGTCRFLRHSHARHCTPFCFHSIPCHASCHASYPLVPLTYHFQLLLVSEDLLLPRVVCSDGCELDLCRQQALPGENPASHRS